MLIHITMTRKRFVEDVEDARDISGIIETDI